jgi:hypothetical protein
MDQNAQNANKNAEAIPLPVPTVSSRPEFRIRRRQKLLWCQNIFQSQKNNYVFSDRTSHFGIK